jgi:predicted amidophosphoribosyltransferase
VEKKTEVLPIICSECGKEKEKRIGSEKIEKYKELFNIDLRKHSRQSPILCDECVQKILEEHDPCPICGKEVSRAMNVFCSEECHREWYRREGIDPGWFYGDCDKCGSEDIRKEKINEYDVRFTCNECGHYWEGEE